MAGANEVPKFLRVDRNNAIVDLKTVGASYSHPNLTPIFGTILTGNQMITNLVFLGGAGAITGPSTTDTWAALASIYQGQLGDQFTVEFQNPTNTAKPI